MSSREPLLNARFRVEIESLPSTGVVEVIFPEARIAAERRNSRTIRYGPLILRRGMSASSDWYEWWQRASQRAVAARKRVIVVLMNQAQADVNRWTFIDAVPSAYTVSPLNAVRSELLIETLELSVRKLTVSFGPADAG